MRPPIAYSTLPPLSTVLALVLLAAPVHSTFCDDLVVSGTRYELAPLGGVRTATRQTDTPPTTSEARVVFDLCSEEGIPRQDGMADEDQCPEGTKACLTMINHKSSAPDQDRITAVVPLWTSSVSESQVRLTRRGKDGEEGLTIDVQGPDYAGSPKNLILDLVCDIKATAPSPSLDSYANDRLYLTWSTPDACPKTGAFPGGSSSPSEGIGLFGFIKLVFWLSVIGLVAYFAIGMFYNHQQYSAKGWDLIPHRDFWREFPVLVQDLVSHVIAGLRGQSGGGGRGGYSSLG